MNLFFLIGYLFLIWRIRRRENWSRQKITFVFS
jgi:hypothetical protein